MTVTFDSSILTAYYNAKAGITTASDGSLVSSSSSTKKYAPTAPWSATATATAANTPSLMTTAVKSAMAGGKLINEDAAQLDLPGASADYKKLFAMFNALNTLSGIADQISGKGLTNAEKDRIKAVYNKGLAEITGYTDTVKLDQIRVTDGQVLDSAKTSVPVVKTVSTYTTPPLISGDVSQPVDAFQGDVNFNISIKRVGVVHDIGIDLSEMGATPRTMGNVVNFINDKLAADGVGTRVSSLRTPGSDRFVKVGDKQVKVGTNPDSWALNFKIDSGDTMTFSAAATEPSIYLAQTVGDPNPDKDPTTKDGVTNSQLLKFQTETDSVPSPNQAANDTNWVDGRAWAKDMDTNVGAVHATQVGPDGSVYVLADVAGSASAKTIKGDQDVALLKYDSAGKLLFTRTLGAASTASGLALAVSADGQVAIAGKVTGGLGGAVNGALNSGDTGSFATSSDSFVTVFNSEGEEQWTQRRGARQNDEATNIAFGADGAVYVAGRSQSTMPGGSALGGWDSYVEGFQADAKNKVTTLFTQTVGSAGSDRPGGLVVDGTSLVMANNEDGHAVLHRFDLSGGAPVETASRDLGDLQGGDIAGLAINGGQIMIAGSTSNGGLDAGSVTNPLTGGKDGFVAQISANLNPSGSDSLSYYGGAGDDKITGLAVSAGKVFVSGQAGTDLPNEDPVGKQDGFVAQINVATGAVGWSRRFTGKAGYASPTTLAVDATGSSVLDRLGLPKGTVDTTPSQQLTAVSSLRAGDVFEIRSGLSTINKKVTIETGDTLDTLATKISRALDFQATVKVVTGTDGTRKLQVTPLNARSTFEFFAGPAGKDALAGLGLQAGVVRTTTADKSGNLVPGDGKGQIYGLKFDGDMSLNTPSSISHVAAELAAAMGVIRQAYKDLQTAATPPSVLAQQKAVSTGTVPAYLTAQIANYQAALDRLTGGG
jgi:hypothetical protein